MENQSMSVVKFALMLIKKALLVLVICVSAIFIYYNIASANNVHNEFIDYIAEITSNNSDIADIGKEVAPVDASAKAVEALDSIGSEAVEVNLNYNQSDINSWNDTLKNLIKIQPSWQKWDKKSTFYKDNKEDIQKINSIITQRISNARKILAVMNINKQIDQSIETIINSDSSLFNEQESLARKINSKSDTYTEKLNSEIKELTNSNKSSNSSIPDYVYTPSSKPIAVDNSSTIAVEAAEKQASCKKIVNQCMSDIGQRIVNLQGSAYDMAARAYGDECNKQYKKCIQ